MNPNEYVNYLAQVKGKIEQVLRIQLKLEQKIESLITSLRNPQSTNQVISDLTLLEKSYKRRLRIIEICENGVDNVSSVLKKFEGEYNILYSPWTRMKAKIGIYPGSDVESSTFLVLHTAFSELRWQIGYANSNSRELKRLTSQQLNVINELSSVSQSYFERTFRERKRTA